MTRIALNQETREQRWVFKRGEPEICIADLVREMMQNGLPYEDAVKALQAVSDKLISSKGLG